MVAFNQVGLGISTSLPDMDFETYSEAGYEWDERANKWRKLNLSGPAGLPATGAPVYAEHVSCDIMCLAYNLKDGRGKQLWVPGCPPPQDLFDHLARGGLIEAHNAGFEAYIWQHVGVKKYGWPELPPQQLRCSKAKCRAWSLPGGLDAAAEVLQLPQRKNPDGTRLLNKFSKPRNPTKADKRLRIDPQEDAIDGPKLYAYGLQDIAVESALSERVPDLTPQELAVWQLDQVINRRGVHIDRETVDAMILVYEAECLRLNAELYQITGGDIDTAGQVSAITGYLAAMGVYTPSLDAEAVDELLARDLPPLARRILEIRQAVGASNIKKLYAFRLRTSADSRLRDMFEYHGAATGRWAGRGVQPQNMASAGPAVVKSSCCGAIRSAHLAHCPYCTIGDPASEPAEWGAEAMESVIRDVKSWHIYDNWPDPVAAMTGCLRGLFTAAPGHDLISSDFSAIEAVVLACMAGEQWRIDVFKTHGKIYEMSASKISGVPFDDFMRHKKETGQHHPLRKTIGKVAELASGYAGWVGAWKAFGADAFMGEPEIKAAILRWRAESPRIVQFWGGQWWQPDPNRWQFEPLLYGLEGAAVQAVMQPGTWYAAESTLWGVVDDALYCQLPSGRFLTYHRPRLDQTTDQRGLLVWQLSYEGYNSDSSKGPVGWMRRSTYGGKLCENVVQAVARDILANSLLNLEAAGYPIVMHVHDEVVAEVPSGTGSAEELERIMGTMPAWCADWPIKAAGGWRGLRYRKE